MQKNLSRRGSQLMATWLMSALIWGAIAPIVSAQTAGEILDQRACERDGGTWNGTSCDMPTPPEDVCPNVSGDQASGPCLDEECTAGGGTWNGSSCDMPTSPDPDPTPPPVSDVCPNVSGNQVSGPCADTTCTANGGTWNGSSCAVPIVDLTEASVSSIESGFVAPEESDTENTDFQDIGVAPTPDPNDTRPIVDMSATTTEMAAEDPKFIVAGDNDGTGSKTGSTIFTGNANAFTTVKNVLNITRANVDGPGKSNSSKITASADNTAELTTTDDTHAFTGENTGLGQEGTATIVTGKAVSTAEVMNVVNTNLFNSNGMVLFLNPQNGDGFDLRSFDLSYFFDEGPGASPTQYGCTILTCLNSSDLTILNKNVAEVKNTVEVRAETGKNTGSAAKEGDVSIQTGNAYAAANVLNLVNTNFINSSYLVLSMNNFGDLNDDIVLPEASFFEQLLASGNTLPQLNSSSYIISSDNDEDFFGTTTARAITGENVATTTGTAFGSGAIHTGNAYSSSNSYTAANQTRVGGASVLLTFRVWGQWSGTIQGLPSGMTWRANRSADNTHWLIEILSNGGGAGMVDAGIYNSSDFMASSTNIARVETDVNVWAVTGQNAAETEDGLGQITTGDAYAAANVINMVNTNIVNRNWIFASFSIFGDWSGDIAFGSHSPDLEVTAAVNGTDPYAPSSDVQYRFTVKNNGDMAASNVVLNTEYNKSLLQFTRSNSTSANTTAGRSWNLGSLAAGASKEVTMDMRILAHSLPPGASLSTAINAVVSSTEHDQNDADNDDSISIVIGSGSSSGGGSSDMCPNVPGDQTATPCADTTCTAGGGTWNGSSCTPQSSGGSSSDVCPNVPGDQTETPCADTTCTTTGGTWNGTSCTAAQSSGGGGSSGGGSSGGGSSGGGSGGGGSSGGGSSGGGSSGGGSSSGGGGGGGGSAGSVAGATTSTTPKPYTGGSSTPKDLYILRVKSGVSIPDERARGSIDPIVSVQKNVSIATTTATTTVNYVVIVKNSKQAQPAYRAILTDTLYDPKGAVVYTRSWPLDTLVPGDEVTLTYAVEFGKTTMVGTYKNVARVTGQRNNTYVKDQIIKMPPAEAWGEVEFAERKPQVLGTTTTPAPAACVPLLTKFLRLGTRDEEVKKLQIFLNSSPDTQVAAFGIGSPGNESIVYGQRTVAAVKVFQQKYASEILTPLGLTQPTGSVYGSTLKKINELACGIVTPVPAEEETTTTTADSTEAPALIIEEAPEPPAKKVETKPVTSTKKTTIETNTAGTDTLKKNYSSWFSKIIPGGF